MCRGHVLALLQPKLCKGGCSLQLVRSSNLHGFAPPLPADDMAPGRKPFPQAWHEIAKAPICLTHDAQIASPSAPHTKTQRRGSSASKECFHGKLRNPTLMFKPEDSRCTAHSTLKRAVHLALIPAFGAYAAQTNCSLPFRSWNFAPRPHIVEPASRKFRMLSVSLCSSKWQQLPV